MVLVVDISFVLTLSKKLVIFNSLNNIKSNKPKQYSKPANPNRKNEKEITVISSMYEPTETVIIYNRIQKNSP